jgi:hypothetical protein
MSKNKFGRSTNRRCDQWSRPTEPGEPGCDFAFAFGSEGCDTYMSSVAQNSGIRFLSEANKVRKHGVYNRCDFAKLVTVPRRAAYIHHRLAQVPLESAPVVEPAKKVKYSQRTVVIVEIRPLHLRTQPHSTPSGLTKASGLVIFQNYDKPHSTGDGAGLGDIGYASFDLTTILLLAVTDERVNDWSAHFTDLEQYLRTLENHVYDHPSDDSPSADLWSLSRHLMDVQDLVSQHAGKMDWVSLMLQRVAESNVSHIIGSSGHEADSLQAQKAELKELADCIEDDFLVTINHMIDLMYKSVCVRDARLSLELNASLWRLSWITVIFLPLTFLVGFFGMNVEIFVKEAPSLKW